MDHDGPGTMTRMALFHFFWDHSGRAEICRSFFLTFLLNQCHKFLDFFLAVVPSESQSIL
jgi:hypothetical protein